jgi:hypothetical protein
MEALSKEHRTICRLKRMALTHCFTETPRRTATLARHNSWIYSVRPETKLYFYYYFGYRNCQASHCAGNHACPGAAVLCTPLDTMRFLISGFKDTV